MSKIFLSLLSLVMITVMAGCSKPAPSAGGEGGVSSSRERADLEDKAAPAAEAPAAEAPAAPAEAPAAPAEAAPAAPAEGAAPAAAPAPSASAAPLSGTTWA